MKNLTLIIPAKHESESLPKVLEEIKDFSYMGVVPRGVIMLLIIKQLQRTY